jgi:alpha-mannosidase
MRRFYSLGILVFMVVWPFRLNGQAVKKFYIAMDDHTDYMWSGTVAEYRTAFLQMLDYYLDLADTTSGQASEYQSRFAADGSYWLWTYEQNKTKPEFERLIGRIKDGHISVPMTLLTLSYGGMPAEAVLRSLYYAGRLERLYGLKFKLAMAQENQTLPYGLGALWAGAGAVYSWKGICGCASRIPNAWDRPYDMYWWSGPDGSRLLMKWYSQIRQEPYGIGGYAEARQIPGIISFADTNADFLRRVPYSIVGLFGYGGDDLSSTTDAVIRAAQQAATSSRTVIVSNEIDFFEDFEATYGQVLPTYRAAFGNEWDNLTASLSEVSGSVKRGVEKLRAAEAMASLVNLHDPQFMRARSDVRDQAWIDLGLYFEHDWGGSGSRVSQADRTRWEKDRAAAFRNYVENLYADAAASLGADIKKEGTRTRVFVFNALSWIRTDFADYPYAGSTAVHVMDLTSGAETPCQLVTLKGVSYLRIWAENVPSLGYKVFEIVPGAGTTVGGGPLASVDTLENGLYRLSLAADGAIRSLQDKRMGGREFVRPIGGLNMNELGPGGGTVSIVNAGPVSATLTAVSPAPLAHTTSVTLFRDKDRVDIQNEITQNFSDTAGWTFGINVDSPEVRHEEIGAFIKARLLDQGGAYAPRAARYDWLTLNHFADMSGGGVGVTLSAADNQFFQTGFSTVEVLDTATPKLTILAGGQIDGQPLGLPNQGGDSDFLQRFALRSHGAYSNGEAMRFALEHQNPLVA